MFEPLTTERLVIRPVEPGDVAPLVARRNDPEVARYQDWDTPYTVEQAEELVSDVAAMKGPEDGRWWMATVCDRRDGAVVGELVVHITWQGRTAEVGYTFARDSWGRGYAIEAMAAWLEYLFDEVGVTRIFGMLHPDNRASAQVLERTGFLFEGHTVASYWGGGEVSDDLIYGMTAEIWDEWRNRNQAPPEQVELVEVTPDNWRAVADLRTHKSQESFVAPVLKSLANSAFPEEVDGATPQPWLRAVTADGELAGFVMVAVPAGSLAEPFLWRLLVDRLHQRKGIGRRILALVEEECRRWGAHGLLTSWVPGKGSPGPFYLAAGFEPTGKMHGPEVEARKEL